MSAVLVGEGAIEPRRFLRLADRATDGRPERSDPYVEGWARVIRALMMDGGVGQAVLDARRAIELAPAVSDAILTGALVVCSRALYFAGDLDEASAMALRFLEHPDAENRLPSLALTRATLALVAIERGQLAFARSHAEKAKAAVGRDRHQPQLARRERVRRARRGAGGRRKARRGGARARLRGAPLPGRGGDA